MSILDKVKANPIGTANTVYLIFPILSLTLLSYKGPLWGGIFVTILFILSYLIMIYEDLTEKVKLRRVLLLIHFLGIIYFVAFFHHVFLTILLFLHMAFFLLNLTHTLLIQIFFFYTLLAHLLLFSQYIELIIYLIKQY